MLHLSLQRGRIPLSNSVVISHRTKFEVGNVFLHTSSLLHARARVSGRTSQPIASNTSSSSELRTNGRLLRNPTSVSSTNSTPISSTYLNPSTINTKSTPGNIRISSKDAANERLRYTSREDGGVSDQYINENVLSEQYGPSHDEAEWDDLEREEAQLAALEAQQNGGNGNTMDPSSSPGMLQEISSDLEMTRISTIALQEWNKNHEYISLSKGLSWIQLPLPFPKVENVKSTTTTDQTDESLPYIDQDDEAIITSQFGTGFSSTTTSSTSSSTLFGMPPTENGNGFDTNRLASVVPPPTVGSLPVILPLPFHTLPSSTSVVQDAWTWGIWKSTGRVLGCDTHAVVMAAIPPTHSHTPQPRMPLPTPISTSTSTTTIGGQVDNQVNNSTGDAESMIPPVLARLQALVERKKRLSASTSTDSTSSTTTEETLDPRRLPVRIQVRLTHGLLSSQLVGALHNSPRALAGLLLDIHSLREGPPGMTRDNRSASPPQVVSSWEREFNNEMGMNHDTNGQHLLGVEYESLSQPLAWPPASSDSTSSSSSSSSTTSDSTSSSNHPITLRHNVTLILDTVKDIVYEITYTLPADTWDSLWSGDEDDDEGIPIIHIQQNGKQMLRWPSCKQLGLEKGKGLRFISEHTTVL